MAMFANIQRSFGVTPNAQGGSRLSVPVFVCACLCLFVGQGVSVNLGNPAVGSSCVSLHCGYVVLSLVKSLWHAALLANTGILPYNLTHSGNSAAISQLQSQSYCHNTVLMLLALCHCLHWLSVQLEPVLD